VNVWAITGRLGHDPKLRTLPSGTLVLNLSVAVAQRRIKDKEGKWVDQPPVWTDVTLFGANGQWLSERLAKGSLVEAVGELGVREYEARDGTRKTQVELVATRVFPLEARDGAHTERSAEHRESRGSGASTGKGYGQPYTRDEAPPFDDDDSIPF
jgi:single-strand DNA-binding protein